MNTTPKNKFAHMSTIIEAMREQKPVQCRPLGSLYDSDWKDTLNSDPNFLHYEYRIKSKFKQYRLAVLLDCNKEPFVFTVNDIKSEVPTENNIRFIKWLTDWVEYEV